ncbi:polyphosphate:AMP phosphotransferase [Orrella sp. JC864]|uniref:polyphosphate:AMP phosphotransferase n=1 Tax=Orrella sp. JC864 TaxID=3120298 RepID=UPI00300A2FEA
MFTEAESDPVLDADTAKELETPLRTALLKAQYARLLDPRRALLIVAAGLDGAGKGATINLLNEWMDPRHIRTLAFGEPGPDEAKRPPLWRYWNALPPAGRIGIVFGSWYMPLMREAARKQPRTARMARHIEDVRRLEATLAANGVQVLKLWFHLSKDAQRTRTRRLLADPDTAWQVAPQDRKVHKRFDRLRSAGQEIIAATDLPHAPWVVIPSADERLRAVRTGQAVLRALSPRHAPRVASGAAGSPAAVRIADRLGRLDYAAHLDKDQYEQELLQWQARLARAVRGQAFSRRCLVLAFEGQDAAGKGGAIRRVTHALDARRYTITPISAPSSEELAHPYLWRFWRRVPAHGGIAIFDRSWYGRVLAERVEKITPPAHWRRAYEEINDFESQLAEAGAVLVKFWLAVSKDEQLRRFHEREKSPFKQFKITPEDWRNREKWDAYRQAANEMFARTDTRHAPWHVIPADDKRHARVEVLKTIVQALEAALQKEKT